MESSEQTGRNVLHGRELLPLLFALLLVSLSEILSYQAWTAFGSRSEQLGITQRVVNGTNDLLSIRSVRL
jgi:hypothetical protein